MPDPAPREWGDGATDRREHVIEDVSYAGGVIACRCGQHVTGSTPDLLADAWVAHGGTVMRLADVAERGSESKVPAEDRAASALNAVVMVGNRCTCDTTPITECPNYLPGDEDGDFSDDE